MMLGYARVSTDGQSLDGQIEELRAAGCTRVYAEKVSGARTDRKELQKALKALSGAPGAVLVCSRLDRLARSTRDLLNILEAVSEAGGQFRSLGDAWCDTTTPHGRLMITVLGGLAEFERSLIKIRTATGRKRFVERGGRLGRKPKLTPDQRRYVAVERAKGEGVRQLARVLGVSKDTIARIPPHHSSMFV
jgi:DNA invertase Pin-like site-specific DNA recombinase